MVFQVTDKELLGKMERIAELSKLGFNVPEYTLIHDATTLDALKREIFPNYKKMSLRTYSRTDELKEFKCPFHPNTSVEDLLKLVDDYVQKYYILVSPPIDPAECLWAGNVITPKLFTDDVTFEYVKGPGTVRDVEKRGKSLVVGRRGDINIDGQLVTDIMHVRDKILRFPREAVIIEWSVYSNRVGKDKDTTVYWEYRQL